MPSLAPLGLVGAAALGAALVWRLAARRKRLPCPTWFAWMLENPYMDAVAGNGMLLDRAAVGPGMRVLDAGCGPGRLTILAARRVGQRGEVVALDVQEGMLARVRQRAARGGIANVRTVFGDIESVAPPAGVEAESFGLALLVAVLGEIPDRAGALRALRTVLRPGGVLSITEVIPDPRYQSRRTVRRLAEGAGFRLDRTYGSPLAFTLNFLKTE